MRNTAQILLAVILFGSLFAPGEGTAGVVPLMIHVDGAANSQTTGPLDGVYSTRFRLYQGGDPQTATGGELVYEESADLEYADGLFSHALGSGTPASACGSEETCMFTESDFDTTDPIYLELAIVGETLLPWFDISSVPFAIRSARVNTVDGAEAGRIEPGGSGLLKVVDGMEILNEFSQKRSELDVNSLDAGAITTYGPNTSRNIRLSTLSGDANHGWLGLMNASGEDRIRMYASSVDVGVAITHSPNGSINNALGYLSGLPDHGYMWVADAVGTERASMYVNSDNAGIIQTFGPNGSENVRFSNVDGRPDDGYISVHDEASVDRVVLFVDDFGDGTVVADRLWLQGVAADATVDLPDNTISSREVLDEPGLSSDFNNPNLTLNSTAYQDLATTTITIPADGYIYVRGQANIIMINLSGSGSTEYVYGQIDEISGGTDNTAPYTVIGTDASSVHQDQLAAERVYFKSAGSYTFRIEAVLDPTGSGFWTIADGAYITALYLPTSYGTVAKAVESSSAGQFESAAPLPVVEHPKLGPSPAGHYRVDLRELEVRSLRAKAEAERAEREYLQAQIQSDSEIDARGSVGEDSEGQR